MDVFDLRNSLISGYADYVRSFVSIKNLQIDSFVESELGSGVLWPPPLVQLNPSFQPGAWIDELVEAGLLSNECGTIFRARKSADDPAGRRMRLHRHQVEAIQTAATRQSYVLTTGTGSGKSLAYIVPIVDHVLRHGSGKGIQAIVVYPMNALANSQLGELDKFLDPLGTGNPSVSYARYTGQEKDERRQEIIANPPDIILTNYVMLELMLTRPEEVKLVGAARDLRFLVFDELHTYRGRQGADVALLIRRLRDLVGSQALQCVGTSATLAGPGSWPAQQAEVATLASRLFGTDIRPEAVIGETLQRVTAAFEWAEPAAKEALARSLEQEIPATLDGFRAFALASWCEDTLGLTERDGRLVRQEPRAVLDPEERSGGVIPSAAEDLATLTNAPLDQCAAAIQRTLLTGYQIRQPETGAPAFAFRLHQFISRGDTVYSSVEAGAGRHLTMTRQQFVPGDRSRRLLPLVFCRECGQEYFCVHAEADPTTSTTRFVPRELSDLSREERLREPAFLYLSDESPWPATGSSEELERLPDDWVEEGPRGPRVRSARRGDVPVAISVNPLGELGSGQAAHLVHAPFRFCLSCGVAYSTRQRKDFGKLATLATEGRSTATSVLVLRALGELRHSDLPATARKLLSFTDNRQDASLQAGHFNDFVEVSRLRGALATAVTEAGPEGIEHDQIARATMTALQLPFEAFAADPTLRGPARQQTESALREVIAYRLYRDFERGWRIVAPNLEQCDLVRIDYIGLSEAAHDAEVWQGSHRALVEATPEERARVARVLLDHMRRELAIAVDALDPNAQESLRQRATQRLREPWTLLDGELLTTATRLIPASRSTDSDFDTIFLSGLSGFGQYLRRPGILPVQQPALKPADAEQIIREVLERLRRYGCVDRLDDKADPKAPGVWRLNAACLRWLPGQGETVPIDPIRVPRGATSPRSPNPFFVAFYREAASTLTGFQAREHTAQVPSDERENREERFRQAKLPVLFCSPTMELGVDIAELNVVNMRNVPPTPANYAQRSGRAGRSGQPALVFTYCASGNSHDQYFYRRPRLMVAGAVSPPRIDLANEDLLRAHIQAVWLRESQKGLGRKLSDILDLGGEPPALALNESMSKAFEDDHAIARAASRGRRILKTLEHELTSAPWFGPSWLEDVLTRLRGTFEASCERWRSLYRAAYQQAEQQGKIILSSTSTFEQVKIARQLRAQAESQLGLLRGDQASIHSDFYSYRYFASEGFLPGYNFPRLPLAAFIPARGSAKQGDDEFISRPRFLAISEFGPRAIVYHDGSKYVTNRVILPVRDDEGAVTSVAKLCGSCGYLHRGEGADLCELCREPLLAVRSNLFRMQNVTTRRRERINSDEEERYRLGYEIHSAFRFEPRGSGPTHRRAEVTTADGSSFADLRYADSANIWRYNLGWVRRSRTEADGFVLDLQSGTWATNKDLEAAGEDSEAAMSKKVARVIPFVEDHRNALIVRPHEPLEPALLASLDAALRKAIQATYQLEDSELASERLPRRDQPRQLLLYESAEGGAGVLRRLVEDPNALPTVARKALELCHFDPDTGADLRRAPHAHEDCEAGCYDCLLSYQNQLDHEMLDRHAIAPLLRALAGGTISTSPTERSRAEHVQELRNLCDSELERTFLDLLEAHRLTLPPLAQRVVEGAFARPDFLYPGLAVFIDGPHHDHRDIAERDRAAEARLEDHGLAVLRLRFDERERWLERLAGFPSTFGVPS